MDMIIMVIAGLLIGLNAAPSKRRGEVFYWIATITWTIGTMVLTAALFSLMETSQLRYQAFGVYIVVAVAVGALMHLVRRLRQPTPGPRW